jgi:hypothetical protein
MYVHKINGFASYQNILGLKRSPKEYVEIERDSQKSVTYKCVGAIESVRKLFE